MTLVGSAVMAQEEVTPKLIFPGDPIPKEFFDLKEVIVLQPIKFNNYDELRRYAILKRRTLKVYPYAQLASNRLTTLRDRLSSIKGKRKKKRYTRQVEKYLQGEFTDELKKLTRSSRVFSTRLDIDFTEIETPYLLKPHEAMESMSCLVTKLSSQAS